MRRAISSIGWGLILLGVVIVMGYSLMQANAYQANQNTINHIGTFTGKVLDVRPYQYSPCGLGSCNPIPANVLTISTPLGSNIKMTVECTYYKVGDTITFIHTQIGNWYAPYPVGCGSSA